MRFGLIETRAGLIGGTSSDLPLPGLLIDPRGSNGGSFGNACAVYREDGEKLPDIIAKLCNYGLTTNETITLLGEHPNNFILDITDPGKVYDAYSTITKRGYEMAKYGQHTENVVRFYKGALMQLILSQLDDLNIPRVHRLGFISEIQGIYNPVFVMDKCGDGHTLYHESTNLKYAYDNDPVGRKAAVGEKLFELMAVADTIDRLHIIHKNPKLNKLGLKLGLIHRDVKPGNILLNKDRRPQLTDFDLSYFNDMTLHYGVMGTLENTSPEQTLSQSATPASDQFQYCVSLAELIAGGYALARHPGKVDNNSYYQVLLANAKDPEKSKVISHFSHHLENYLGIDPVSAQVITGILNTGLSFNPGDRFLNCRIPNLLVALIVSARSLQELELAVALGKYATGVKTPEVIDKALVGLTHLPDVLNYIGQCLWFTPGKLGNYNPQEVFNLLGRKYNGLERELALNY